MEEDDWDVEDDDTPRAALAAIGASYSLDSPLYREPMWAAIGRPPANGLVKMANEFAQLRAELGRVWSDETHRFAVAVFNAPIADLSIFARAAGDLLCDSMLDGLAAHDLDSKVCNLRSASWRVGDHRRDLEPYLSLHAAFELLIYEAENPEAERPIAGPMTKNIGDVSVRVYPITKSLSLTRTSTGYFGCMDGTYYPMDKSFMLMIAGVLTARFNVILYTQVHDDPSVRLPSRDLIRRLHQWGDGLVRAHGNAAFHAIKCLEPLCMGRGHNLSDSPELVANTPRLWDATVAAVLALEPGMPGAMEVVSLIESVHDSGIVFELFGMFRHFGHPYVSATESMRASLSIGRSKTHVDISAERLSAGFRRWDFIKAYRSKHGTHPPYDFDKDPTINPKLVEHLISGVSPVASGPDWTLKDYAKVHFGAAFALPNRVDLADVINDRACAAPRSVTAEHLPRRLGPLDQRKVTIHHLFHGINDPRAFIAEHDGAIPPRDWCIAYLREKEREVKPEIGRVYTMLPAVPRLALSLSEGMTARFLRYVPSATMSDDDVKLSNKRDGAIGRPGGSREQLIIHISLDFQKWNWHMRDAFMQDIHNMLSELHGLKNFFAIPAYVLQNATYIGASNYYPPQTRGHGADVEFLEDQTCVNGNGPCSEGMMQKQWTYWTVEIVRSVMRRHPIKFKNLGMGDNQVLSLHFDFADTITSDDRVAAARKANAVIQDLAATIAQFGHTLKVDETWISDSTHVYGKEIYQRGILAHLMLKKIATMTWRSNEKYFSTANCMGALASCAESTTKYDHTGAAPHLVYCMASAWFLKLAACHNPLAGSQLLQRLVSSPYDAVLSRRGPENARIRQALGVERAACRLLTTVILATGGAFTKIPIVDRLTIAIRSCSDLGTHAVARARLAIRFLVEDRRTVEAEAITAVISPFLAHRRDCLLLLMDPYSYNDVSTARSENVIKSSVADYFRSIRNRIADTRLVAALEYAGRRERTIIDALATMRPYLAFVASEIHLALPSTYATKLIQTFASTEACINLARASGHCNVQSRIVKCECDLWRTVIWKLIQHDRQRALLHGTLSCVDFSDKLRSDSWGFEVVGVTTASPISFLRVVGEDHPTIDGSIHLSLSNQAREGRWDIPGPHHVYAGSEVQEKSVTLRYEGERAVPVIKNAAQMARLIDWAISRGGHLHDLVKAIQEVWIRGDVDLLSAVMSGSGGTVEHRMKDPSGRRGGRANFNLVVTTHVGFTSMTLLRTARGGQDVNLNFPAVYLWAILQLRAGRNPAQDSSTGTLYAIIEDTGDIRVVEEQELADIDPPDWTSIRQTLDAGQTIELAVDVRDLLDSAGLLIRALDETPRQSRDLLAGEIAHEIGVQLGLEGAPALEPSVLEGTVCSTDVGHGVVRKLDPIILAMGYVEGLICGWLYSHVDSDRLYRACDILRRDWKRAAMAALRRARPAVFRAYFLSDLACSRLVQVSPDGYSPSEMFSTGMLDEQCMSILSTLVIEESASIRHAMSGQPLVFSGVMERNAGRVIRLIALALQHSRVTAQEAHDALVDLRVAMSQPAHLPAYSDLFNRVRRGPREKLSVMWRQRERVWITKPLPRLAELLPAYLPHLMPSAVWHSAGDPPVACPTLSPQAMITESRAAPERPSQGPSADLARTVVWLHRDFRSYGTACMKLLEVIHPHLAELRRNPSRWHAFCLADGPGSYSELIIRLVGCGVTYNTLMHDPVDPMDQSLVSWGPQAARLAAAGMPPDRFDLGPGACATGGDLMVPDVIAKLWTGPPSARWALITLDAQRMEGFDARLVLERLAAHLRPKFERILVLAKVFLDTDLWIYDLASAIGWQISKPHSSGVRNMEAFLVGAASTAIFLTQITAHSRRQRPGAYETLLDTHEQSVRAHNMRVGEWLRESLPIGGSSGGIGGRLRSLIGLIKEADMPDLPRIIHSRLLGGRIHRALPHEDQPTITQDQFRVYSMLIDAMSKPTGDAHGSWLSAHDRLLELTFVCIRYNDGHQVTYPVVGMSQELRRGLTNAHALRAFSVVTERHSWYGMSTTLLQRIAPVYRAIHQWSGEYQRHRLRAPVGPVRALLEGQLHACFDCSRLSDADIGVKLLAIRRLERHLLTAPNLSVEDTTRALRLLDTSDDVSSAQELVSVCNSITTKLAESVEVQAFPPLEARAFAERIEALAQLITGTPQLRERIAEKMRHVPHPVLVMGVSEPDVISLQRLGSAPTSAICSLGIDIGAFAPCARGTLVLRIAGDPNSNLATRKETLERFRGSRLGGSLIGAIASIRSRTGLADLDIDDHWRSGDRICIVLNEQWSVIGADGRPKRNSQRVIYEISDTLIRDGVDTLVPVVPSEFIGLLLCGDTGRTENDPLADLTSADIISLTRHAERCPVLKLPAWTRTRQQLHALYPLVWSPTGALNPIVESLLVIDSRHPGPWVGPVRTLVRLPPHRSADLILSRGGSPTGWAIV